MFDPSKCGYIIKNMLLEFRAEQKEANGINHMMIKVLLELFDQMQAEDNEKYVKAVTRKSKKTTKLRKTTNAWAVQLPPKHVKKIHMNFDEFHGFLSENYLLVQAFISRILMTMEAVYMRNKTAAARLAQRRQQAEAAKTKSEADNDSTKAESQASPVSTRGNSRGNLERMESMGSMLTSRSSRHMGGGDDQCPSFRNMVSARRGDMTSRRGDMTARSTLNEPLPSRRGDMTSRSNLNDSMATARSRAGDASARSLRTARSLRGGGLLSASPSTSAQDIAT
jgi:antitoxin component of MazEF toxin-antitoxin module